MWQLVQSKHNISAQLLFQNGGLVPRVWTCRVLMGDWTCLLLSPSQRGETHTWSPSAHRGTSAGQQEPTAHNYTKQYGCFTVVTIVARSHTERMFLCSCWWVTWVCDWAHVMLICLRHMRDVRLMLMTSARNQLHTVIHQNAAPRIFKAPRASCLSADSFFCTTFSKFIY